MSKVDKKLDIDLDYQEIIDTPIAELIEENVYVDENLIKNKSLIRIDLNLIQFPIFSKNTHRKVNQIVKYYFNQNRETFITVTPQAGDYIPGEMEEKVFIALMQIMKEKGMARKIIVSSLDIKQKIKISTIRYNDIISKALSRLATTNYTFKNTLYSSENKGVISDKIETSIFNIRTITLSKKENAKYRKDIKDKRIKTIYEIEFSEHFYNNIIQKGYMVYDGNTLLEIESSTARTIYMLIEKLRFENLYLKLDTIFLIKRIPLKIDNRNLTQTINTLKKAFQELVDKDLILSFNFIKEKTWHKSEIEIYFPKGSEEIKQKRFFEDRNDFRRLLTLAGVSDTEHQMIEDIKSSSTLELKDTVVTEETVDKILGLMPSKARTLKTMPKTIKDAILEYGYPKVEAVAIYMKKNKVEKIRAYFLKALEQNWTADEEVINNNLEIGKVLKDEKIEILERDSTSYNEEFYSMFEELPIEIQNGIETYAYREYINMCGMETKIQKLAFSASRKKYICEYLEKYPEILSLEKQEKKNEEVDYLTENRYTSNSSNQILKDINKIKEIIRDTIELAEMINNYDDEEKQNILKIILQEVLPFVKESALTKNKLDEILKKYTGF